MRVFWAIAAPIIALASSGAVAAATLPVSWVEEAPDGRQKVWHATLDQRTLPANTRPSQISAEIAVHRPPGAKPARITVSLNGLVIAREWAGGYGATTVRAPIEDRLLSTRNDLTVAVTAPMAHCPAETCSVRDARLPGGLRIDLAPATKGPLSFAQYVTRFRAGVAVHVRDPRDRAWADLAVEAMAPRAPLGPKGPTEIVVSRTPPPGTAPELRFDTGAVEIRNREGAVIYSETALNRYTVVQITQRGDKPVLWVRPGTAARPIGPMELDYGKIALFGENGREIVFSPAQDKALTIEYAAAAEREAQIGLYWRLAVLAIWLAITAGLVVIVRRMPPLQPRKA